MEMYIPEKRVVKNYRYQLSDLETLRVAEAFSHERISNPGPKGKYILNKVLTSLGIRMQVTQYDVKHPLIKSCEDWLTEVWGKGGNQQAACMLRIASANERMAQAMENIPLLLNKPKERSQKVNRKVEVQDNIEAEEMYDIKEAAYLLSLCTASVRKLIKSGSLKATKKYKTDAYRISRKDLTAWLEGEEKKVMSEVRLKLGGKQPEKELAELKSNRKSLGNILAANRKHMGLNRRELAELMPTFEPYADYTASIRKPINYYGAIAQIENGCHWPSAKGLQGLIQVLKIPVSQIHEIMDLLPEGLKTSLNHHNIRLLPHTSSAPKEENTVEITESQIEEVLENIDNQIFTETNSQAVITQYPALVNTQPTQDSPTNYEAKPNNGLRIGVLGDLGKRWNRPGLNFGNHVIEFIDADKVRQLNGNKYDYLVHTSFHGHKATKKLGDIPVCKLPEGNNLFTLVRTPKQLMHWLSLWDKSLV
jgi:excisionase family DNA binding protein